LSVGGGHFDEQRGVSAVVCLNDDWLDDGNLFTADVYFDRNGGGFAGRKGDFLNRSRCAARATALDFQDSDRGLAGVGEGEFRFEDRLAGLVGETLGSSLPFEFRVSGNGQQRESDGKFHRRDAEGIAAKRQADSAPRSFLSADVWHQFAQLARQFEGLGVHCARLSLQFAQRNLQFAHRNIQSAHLNIQCAHMNIQSAHENIQSAHENIQSAHENIQLAHGNLESAHGNLQYAQVNLQSTPINLKSALAGVYTGCLHGLAAFGETLALWQAFPTLPVNDVLQ